MTFRSLLFSGIILTFILIVRCANEKSDNEIFIDELMKDYDGNGTSVPGASVLVICKNVPIVRRSYGFANIEEHTPVISMTNFRLASLTKQFTAAAILLLAEKRNGSLQLDDRIREKWLPTLPEATDAITIRHLLTHTSGLIDYEDVIDVNIDPNYQLSDSDVLDILSSQNRTYFTPPGARYRYSNSGYALLALIVERASGTRFANFLHEQIFLPLQMNGTVAYENGISTIVHRAFGYSDNDSSWIRTDQSQTSAVLGDGGIYSSIDDLVKWDTALYDDRLLSLESLQLAFTPAVRTDDPAIQYGMGWQISGDMLWHSGSTIGFRNIILRFPKRHLTVVILTNRNYPAPYQTALTIAHRFFFTVECSESYFSCSSFVHWKRRIVFWPLIYFFFVVFYY
jgi:CubicO group peptidase (beta-lactamase class C family)